MPAADIVIKGAREHNLRDVDVVLPRNKLLCLTGVEDKLQDGVRASLETLRNAGIRVWMLTGALGIGVPLLFLLCIVGPLYITGVELLGLALRCT